MRKVLEGMLYLQEQWPEVGFDLITSSVLLSKGGQPPISRFRVGDGNSNKKNIYKFGVLLLEMIANKQPKDFKQCEASLIEWVKTHYQENIWKAIDDTLTKAGITHEQANKGIRFGIMCAEIRTKHHFKMAQVYDIITRFYESTRISRSPNH
ncbi:kinase domain [Thalictrum thalictroides]|uniref:Kinase domain n=1 Tax=Thalictrum thalictroides TaxID=46969 RepID=A0A7J6VT72_THATH|nr:kinase domain [Thalictrum thalictroides]